MTLTKSLAIAIIAIFLLIPQNNSVVSFTSHAEAHTVQKCHTHWKKHKKIKHCKYVKHKHHHKKPKKAHRFPSSEKMEVLPSVGLIAIASKYEGLSERGNTKALQSLMGVNPRSTPWCAAFVNSVLHRRGHRGSGSNLAHSFSHYGIAVSNPKAGDIVVLKHRHVGFFKGYVIRNGKKYVAVLGGNQSNKVKVSYYPIGKVKSFRRPV